MNTAAKRARGASAVKRNRIKKKQDGAPVRGILPSVLTALISAVLCFLIVSAAAAVILWAADAPFSLSYVGYLAAAGASSAVSSVVFCRRCRLPSAVSSPVWAAVCFAVHLLMTIVFPLSEHRLAILLCAAVPALLCGFLFGRLNKG